MKHNDEDDYCDCSECAYEREEEDRRQEWEDVCYTATQMKAGSLWNLRCDEEVVMVMLEDCPDPRGCGGCTVRALILDGEWCDDLPGSVIEITDSDFEMLEEWSESY